MRLQVDRKGERLQKEAGRKAGRHPTAVGLWEGNRRTTAVRREGGLPSRRRGEGVDRGEGLAGFPESDSMSTWLAPRYAIDRCGPARWSG